LSIILDTSDFLPGIIATINQLDYIEVRYKKPKAIKLGYFYAIEYEEAMLPLKANYFMDDKHTRVRLDFFDAFLIEDTKFELFIKLLRVDGYPDYGEIDGMPFEVRPGYKHTFVVKPGVCGAFMGSNNTNFREFMCHNLGGKKYYKGRSTSGYDSNLYAWGRKKVFDEKIDNPPYESGNVWKKSEDPCPTGYRVPTIGEWTDVLNEDYNDWEFIDTNPSCVWRIGRLFLVEKVNYKYWSSSGYVNSFGDELAFTIYVSRYKGVTKFYSGRERLNFVRCIKKLPNE